MTTTQKVIKYLAVALAVFLIVSIISGIVSAVIALGKFLTNDDNYKLDNYKTLEISKDFNSLDLDIAATNIYVKNGEELKIETNNKNIYSKIDGKKLTIKEDKKIGFRKKLDSDVIVYLPNDYDLAELKIDSGAGKLEISNISVNRLDLNLGAGKAILSNVTSSGATDIDGGAGSIEVTNSTFHNLDLDMGAGKLEIEALITGKNDIDCGVGETTVNLIGQKNDYRLSINKGVGSVIVDGDSYGDKAVIGDGDNYIDIDGGVGNIKINFTDKER